MVEAFRKYKIITLLAIVGVVYFFLEFIVPLIAPVLVAMLFVTIFGPLLKKMQQRLHLHRQIGAVLLLIVFGAVISLLFWMLLTWIIGSLPQWLQNMEGMWATLTETVHQISSFGSRLIGMDNVYLEEMLLSRMQEGIEYLQEGVIPNVLSGSVKYAKELLEVGGFLLLFVIATVFLAKDYDAIMNKMIDRQECHILLEIICGIIRYIATFVKAQLLIMLVIGSVCAIGLSVIGVPSGAFWGILAGVLDALPLLGTGIVLVPLALVQLVEGNYVRALFCILIYLVCIFIRELLEPKLIGGRMGIPPLVVLVAIYVGLQLFGVFGIIKGPLGFVLIYQTYLSLQKQGWWKSAPPVKKNTSEGKEVDF